MLKCEQSLWILAYAIGDEKYACTIHVGKQAHAEQKVNHILSYAKHIRKIGLYECKDPCTAEYVPTHHTAKDT